MANKQSNIRARVAALLLACVILAGLRAAPPAASAEQRDENTVRVGWYESPFNLTDQYGRRSGYAYEYQRKITAYTGWTYNTSREAGRSCWRSWSGARST